MQHPLNLTQKKSNISIKWNIFSSFPSVARPPKPRFSISLPVVAVTQRSICLSGQLVFSLVGYICIDWAL